MFHFSATVCQKDARAQGESLDKLLGRREPMKRALDCFCGEYLEGDNDEELLNWTRAHVQRKHSDMDLADEQIEQVVAEGAYDTQGKAQER
jgi:predicted small metal-binding protein